jgi:ubiquinone/menaquinone biosynthesis C-methylase UbiE
VSHYVYEAYDDWEMRAYEKGSNWTLDHGQMNLVSFIDVRNYYLAAVISEVKRLYGINERRPIEVLEVGCGNDTNLMVLAAALGEKVKLRGIDISAQRIAKGQLYWGEKLNGVEMVEDSATTLATQNDASADLVFSLHCLDQIPYSVDDCLRSMARVTRGRVVFCEPVWEYANTTQKLYSLIANQLRTLLPSMPLCGLEVVEQYKAELIANPLNQSGIVIANKT